MPTLTITKNYDDLTTLTEQQLDDAFGSVTTFVNTTKLDSSNIQSGGIATANYAAGSVDATALASNAVTTAKIQDVAVTAAKIADGAIDTAAKLASSIVTTAKIADSNVTAAKIESSINLPGNAVQENGKMVVVSCTNPSNKSLGIIRGQYSSSATTVDSGEGFTLSKNGTGDMTVNFSTTFSDTPVVVATAGPGAINNRLVQLNTISTSSCRIKTYDLSSVAQEASVNFIVMGQRP